MNENIVLWDVDGVLAETETIHRGILETLAQAGGGAIEPQDWDEYQGKGAKYIGESLAQKFSRFAFSPASFAQRADERYLAKTSGIQARHGVDFTLKALRSHGIAQSIITNSPTQAWMHTLKRAGITSKYFDCVTDRDDFARHHCPAKPHPAAFDLAAQRAARAASMAIPSPMSKSDWQHVVLVEDSPHNIEAAHKLGITTVQWRLPESLKVPVSQHADFVVDVHESPTKAIRQALALTGYRL